MATAAKQETTDPRLPSLPSPSVRSEPVTHPNRIMYTIYIHKYIPALLILDTTGELAPDGTLPSLELSLGRCSCDASDGLGWGNQV